MESKRPLWISVVRQDYNFPRERTASDIGVKSSFAIPVLAEGRVAAAMEFLSFEIEEPADNLLDTLNHIADEMSQVFNRAERE